MANLTVLDKIINIKNLLVLASVGLLFYVALTPVFAGHLGETGYFCEGTSIVLEEDGEHYFAKDCADEGMECENGNSECIGTSSDGSGESEDGDDEDDPVDFEYEDEEEFDSNLILPDRYGDTGCDSESLFPDPETWEYRGLDCSKLDSDSFDQRGEKWVCKKEGRDLATLFANGEKCFEEDTLRQGSEQLRQESYSTDCDPDSDPDPNLGWKYLQRLECDPGNPGYRGQPWFCKGVTKFTYDQPDNSCSESTIQEVRQGGKTNSECKAESGEPLRQCIGSRCIQASWSSNGVECVATNKEINIGLCPNSCKESLSDEEVNIDQENLRCQEQAGDNYYCDGEVCIDRTKKFENGACTPAFPKVPLEKCQEVGQKCTKDIPSSGFVSSEDVCKYEFGEPEYFCNQNNVCFKKQAKLEGEVCGKEEVEVSGSELEKCPASCQGGGFSSRLLTEQATQQFLSGKDAECKEKGGDPIYYCDGEVCKAKVKGYDPSKNECIDTFPTIYDKSKCANECKGNTVSTGLVPKEEVCKYQNQTEYFCEKETCVAKVSIPSLEGCRQDFKLADRQTSCGENACKGNTESSGNPVPTDYETPKKPSTSQITQTTSVPKEGNVCQYNQKCPKQNQSDKDTFQSCLGTWQKNQRAELACVYLEDSECSECVEKEPDLSLNNTTNKCELGVCLNKPGPVCFSDANCRDTKPGEACNFPTSQDCPEGQTKACRGELSVAGVCEYKDFGSGSSCTQCSAKAINLRNRDNRCDIQDGKAVCLNAPGTRCTTDTDCPQPQSEFQSRALGPSQIVGVDGMIYKAIEVCSEERKEAASAWSPCSENELNCDLNAQIYASQKDIAFRDCVKKYVPTGIPAYESRVAQITVNATNTDLALKRAQEARDALADANLNSQKYGDSLDDQRQEEARKEFEYRQKNLELLVNGPGDKPDPANPDVKALEVLKKSSTYEELINLGQERERQKAELEQAEKEAEEALISVRRANYQYQISSDVESEGVKAVADREAEKARVAIEKLKSLEAKYPDVKTYGQLQADLGKNLEAQLVDIPRQVYGQRVVESAKEANDLYYNSFKFQAENGTYTQDQLVGKLNYFENLAKQNIEALEKVSPQAAIELRNHNNTSSYDGWMLVFENKLRATGGIVDDEDRELEQITVNIQDNINKVRAARGNDEASFLLAKFNSTPFIIQTEQAAQTYKNSILRAPQARDELDEAQATENLLKAKSDYEYKLGLLCDVSLGYCDEVKKKYGANGEIVADSAFKDRGEVLKIRADLEDKQAELFNQARFDGDDDGRALALKNIELNRAINELAKIDKGLALSYAERTNQVLAQGKKAQEIDFSKSTYLANRDLLLSLNKFETDGSQVSQEFNIEDEKNKALSRVADSLNTLRKVDPKAAEELGRDYLAFSNLTAEDKSRLKLISDNQGKTCFVQSKCDDYTGSLESSACGVTINQVSSQQCQTEAQTNLATRLGLDKNASFDEIARKAQELADDEVRKEKETSNTQGLQLAANAAQFSGKAAICLTNPLTKAIGDALGICKETADQTKQFLGQTTQAISDDATQAQRYKGTSEHNRDCINSEIFGYSSIDSIGTNCQIDTRSARERSLDVEQGLRDGLSLNQSLDRAGLTATLTGDPLIDNEINKRRQRILTIAKEWDQDNKIQTFEDIETKWTEDERKGFVKALSLTDPNLGKAVFEGVLFSITPSQRIGIARELCTDKFGAACSLGGSTIPEQTLSGMSETDLKKLNNQVNLLFPGFVPLSNQRSEGKAGDLEYYLKTVQYNPLLAVSNNLTEEEKEQRRQELVARLGEGWTREKIIQAEKTVGYYRATSNYLLQTTSEGKQLTGKTNEAVNIFGLELALNVLDPSDTAKFIAGGVKATALAIGLKKAATTLDKPAIHFADSVVQRGLARSANIGFDFSPAEIREAERLATGYRTTRDQSYQTLKGLEDLTSKETDEAKRLELQTQIDQARAQGLQTQAKLDVAEQFLADAQTGVGGRKDVLPESELEKLSAALKERTSGAPALESDKPVIVIPRENGRVEAPRPGVKGPVEAVAEAVSKVGNQAQEKALDLWDRVNPFRRVPKEEPASVFTDAPEVKSPILVRQVDEGRRNGRSVNPFEPDSDGVLVPAGRSADVGVTPKPDVTPGDVAERLNGALEGSRKIDSDTVRPVPEAQAPIARNVDNLQRQADEAQKAYDEALVRKEQADAARLKKELEVQGSVGFQAERARGELERLRVEAEQAAKALEDAKNARNTAKAELDRAKEAKTTEAATPQEAEERLKEINEVTLPNVEKNIKGAKGDLRSAELEWRMVDLGAGSIIGGLNFLIPKSAKNNLPVYREIAERIERAKTLLKQAEDLKTTLLKEKKELESKLSGSGAEGKTQILFRGGEDPSRGFVSPADETQKRVGQEAVERAKAQFQNGRGIDPVETHGRKNPDGSIKYTDPQFSPSAGSRSPNIFRLQSPEQLESGARYNYIITDQNDIWAIKRFTGDPSLEQGHKHIQLWGAAAQLDERGIPGRGVNVVKSGELTVGTDGIIRVDLESGTFGRRNLAAWNPYDSSNLEIVEEAFEGKLGKRPLGVDNSISPTSEFVEAAKGRLVEKDAFRVYESHFGPSQKQDLKDYLLINTRSATQGDPRGGFASTAALGSEQKGLIENEIVAYWLTDEAQVRAIYGEDAWQALVKAAQEKGVTVAEVANDYALRTEIGEATYIILDFTASRGSVPKAGGIPKGFQKLLQSNTSEEELVEFSKEILEKWDRAYWVRPTNRYSGGSGQNLYREIPEWKSEGFADGIAVEIKRRSGQTLDTHDQFIWNSFNQEQKDVIENAADFLLPPKVEPKLSGDLPRIDPCSLTYAPIQANSNVLGVSVPCPVKFNNPISNAAQVASQKVKDSVDSLLNGLKERFFQRGRDDVVPSLPVPQKSVSEKLEELVNLEINVNGLRSIKDPLERERMIDIEYSRVNSILESVNTGRSPITGKAFNKTISQTGGLEQPMAVMVEYITGYVAKDKADLRKKLIADQASIRQQLGLPIRDLRFDEPERFLAELKGIAEANDIKIIRRQDAPEYLSELRDNSFVGAMYDDISHSVYVKEISDADLLKDLSTLEHEIIHGLDNRINPYISIEEAEYRAYIANLSRGASDDETLEYLNFALAGSINTIYREYYPKVVPLWKESRIQQLPLKHDVVPQSIIPGPCPVSSLDSNLAQANSNPIKSDSNVLGASSPCIRTGNPLFDIPQAASERIRGAWDGLLNSLGVAKKAEVVDVVDIVKRVDDLLSLEVDAKNPGCRLGYCGYSSALVERAAEKEGMKADVYQVRSLHEAMGSSREEVFQHAFTIIEKDNQKYLVDLTFSQFIRENGVIAVSLNPNPSGRLLKDFPVISELLDRGYIPLTDENLRQYLKATSLHTVSDEYLLKIDRVAAEELLPKVNPLGPYRSQEYLDSKLAKVEFPCPARRITYAPLSTPTQAVLGLSVAQVPCGPVRQTVSLVDDVAPKWLVALTSATDKLAGGSVERLVDDVVTRIDNSSFGQGVASTTDTIERNVGEFFAAQNDIVVPIGSPYDELALATGIQPGVLERLAQSSNPLVRGTVADLEKQYLPTQAQINPFFSYTQRLSENVREYMSRLPKIFQPESPSARQEIAALRQTLPIKGGSETGFDQLALKASNGSEQAFYNMQPILEDFIIERFKRTPDIRDEILEAFRNGDPDIVFKVVREFNGRALRDENLAGELIGNSGYRDISLTTDKAKGELAEVLRENNTLIQATILDIKRKEPGLEIPVWSSNLQRESWESTIKRVKPEVSGRDDIIPIPCPISQNISNLAQSESNILGASNPCNVPEVVYPGKFGYSAETAAVLFGQPEYIPHAIPEMQRVTFSFIDKEKGLVTRIYDNELPTLPGEIDYFRRYGGSNNVPELKTIVKDDFIDQRDGSQVKRTIGYQLKYKPDISTKDFPTSDTKDSVKYVNTLEGLTDEDIVLLDKQAKYIAGQTKDYDFVLVTGKSGEVSRVLLERQGVDPQKIIEFDEYLNALVYKDSRYLEAIGKTGIADQERTKLIRQALIDKGVPLEDESSGPKILIVDDRVDTGTKAIGYIQRFREIEGLGDFRFTEIAPESYEGDIVRSGKIFKSEITFHNSLNNIFRSDVNFKNSFDYSDIVSKTLDPLKAPSYREFPRIREIFDSLAGTTGARSNKEIAATLNIPDFVLADMERAADEALGKLRVTGPKAESELPKPNPCSLTFSQTGLAQASINSNPIKSESNILGASTGGGPCFNNPVSNFFQRISQAVHDWVRREPERYGGVSGPSITTIDLRQGITKLEAKLGKINDQVASVSEWVFEKDDGLVTVLVRPRFSSKANQYQAKVDAYIKGTGVPGLIQLESVFRDSKTKQITGFSYKKPNIDIPISETSGRKTISASGLNLNLRDRADLFENILQAQAITGKAGGFLDGGSFRRTDIGIETITRADGSEGKKIWFLRYGDDQIKAEDEARKVIDGLFTTSSREKTIQEKEFEVIEKFLQQQINQGKSAQEAWEAAKNYPPITYMLDKEAILKPLVTSQSDYPFVKGFGLFATRNAEKGSGYAVLSPEAQAKLSFSTYPKYQIVLDNGEKWTFAKEAYEFGGRTVVWLRKNDGRVTGAYLSLSEGDFKWFVGMVNPNSSEVQNQGWVVKSEIGGKEYANVPDLLDTKLKEALQSKDISIIQKEDDPKEVFRILDQDFGMGYEIQREGWDTMGNLLNEKVVQIPFNQRYINDVDFSKPTQVIFNGAGIVDVYFEGSRSVARVSFYLEPHTRPVILKEGAENIAKVADINVTYRPKGNPYAVFEDAPRIERTYPPVGRVHDDIVAKGLIPPYPETEEFKRLIPNDQVLRIAEYENQEVFVTSSGDWQKIAGAVRAADSPEVQRLVALANDSRPFNQKKDEVLGVVNNLKAKSENLKQVGQAKLGSCDIPLNPQAYLINSDAKVLGALSGGPCFNNPIANTFQNFSLGVRESLLETKARAELILDRVKALPTDLELRKLYPANQWRKEGFEAPKVINERRGPVIEVAGPTERGYELVDVQDINKKLHVSNIAEEGSAYCGGAIQGKVDFRTDSTMLGIRNRSVGGVFASCLPTPIRAKAVKEAYRVLEDGGILVWQGAFSQDVQAARNLGFEIVEYTRSEKSPTNRDLYNKDHYQVIFQKTGRNN